MRCTETMVRTLHPIPIIAFLCSNSSGPIVRVTPNEIHFDDPDFLETLYPNRGKNVDKPEFVAVRAGSKWWKLDKQIIFSDFYQLQDLLLQLLSMTFIVGAGMPSTPSSQVPVSAGWSLLCKRMLGSFFHDWSSLGSTKLY